MPRGKCSEPSFSTWLLTCIACKVFIAQGINFVFQFYECEDLCWEVGKIIEEKRPKYLQNISIVKHLFVFLEFLVWKFKHFHYYIILILDIPRVDLTVVPLVSRSRLETIAIKRYVFMSITWDSFDRNQCLQSYNENIKFEMSLTNNWNYRVNTIVYKV